MGTVLVLFAIGMPPQAPEVRVPQQAPPVADCDCADKCRCPGSKSGECGCGTQRKRTACGGCVCGCESEKATACRCGEPAGKIDVPALAARIKSYPGFQAAPTPTPIPASHTAYGQAPPGTAWRQVPQASRPVKTAKDCGPGG